MESRQIQCESVRNHVDVILPKCFRRQARVRTPSRAMRWACCVCVCVGVVYRWVAVVVCWEGLEMLADEAARLTCYASEAQET